MSKRNWIIGSFAVMLFMLLLVYFFFPSENLSGSRQQKEKKVSFLDVDPQWADSLIKTLSIEEKAAMLIMYRPQPNLKSDSIFLDGHVPGAYLLSSDNILRKSEKVDMSRSLLISRFDQIPVTDKIKFPAPGNASNTILGNPEIFFSLTDDSIRNESKVLLKKSSDYHSLDGIILPMIGSADSKYPVTGIFKNDTSRFLRIIGDYGDYLVSENFLSGSSLLTGFHQPESKSTIKDSILKTQKDLGKIQLPLFFVDSAFSTDGVEADEIAGYLKKEFRFNGLCIAMIRKKENSDSEKLKVLLNGGVDLIQTENFMLLHFQITDLLRKGEIKENIINAKVKRILLAKTWSKLKRKRANYQNVTGFSAYEKSFPRRIRKATLTLVKNERNLLPLRNVINNRMAVIHLGHQPAGFIKNIYHYLPDEQTVPVKIIKELKDHVSLNVSDFRKFKTIILTIHGDITKDNSILGKMNELAKNSELIIINFQFPKNLSSLGKFSSVIQTWGNTLVESEFSAQAVFGGVTMNARLPFSFGKASKIGKSVSLKQSRLQYTIPEDIGIASDSLAKISYIMEEGIRNKAFPGAQVFFALDGKVFYNRAFGTHTYADRQEVKTNDLFDMASVTKVAASTIVAMSCYEKGMYRLDDSLYKHIPDTLKKHIHGKSSLRNITFKQILIHATGLASGQPIIKYIRYRDSLLDRIGRFDKYYCDYPDDYYKIKVAEGFYMEREQADTIWYAMNRMSVDENPSYRYSDANMNLLYKLLDSKIKNRWQYYLDSLFYKPLGMFNSCYLPLDHDVKPERIVPTENDRYWRKQLLRGYVHDPTAALFGGVAGNAGLFSTAEDIGILFQMLMYKGSYGGNSYFKKETVDLFISQQSGSHRGLGFNRQVKGNTYGVSPFASNNTFGHTGFTGISVWADMDIKLLYVSCTNRVHPDAENKKIINLGTTKRVHNVIYEQLEYLMPDKIDLYK